MEDIDGGLHPAVDGQSLDEDEDEIYVAFQLNRQLLSWLVTKWCVTKH